VTLSPRINDEIIVDRGMSRVSSNHLETSRVNGVHAGIAQLLLGNCYRQTGAQVARRDLFQIWNKYGYR
jgi:hypothetical protein